MNEETLENSPDQSRETVNTGGGAYIAKSVYMGSGDLIGRDKIIHDSVIIGVPIEDIEYLPPESGEPPYQGLRYFDEKDTLDPTPKWCQIEQHPG